VPNQNPGKLASSWGSYRQSFPTINQTGIITASDDYNKLGNKNTNMSEMNTLDRQYSCCGGGGDDQEGVNFGGMVGDDMEYYENRDSVGGGGGAEDTPYTDKKQL
jgi:hypothetical protein